MRVHFPSDGAAVVAREPHHDTASKLGRVATTAAPAEQSCPHDCALWDACFYRRGLHLGRVNRELEAASAGATPGQVALAEATAIDLLVGDVPLRVHVGGDARTRLAARRIGAAVGRYVDRGGQPAWTYTHAWRRVPRSAWGPAISVLASVESPDQIRHASARGYAAALTVDRHPEDGRAWVAPDGTRVIPCVEQTRGVSCTECRLCFDADALRRRRAAIAFAMHGPITRVGKPILPAMMTARGRTMRRARWAREPGAASVDLIRARKRRGWSDERAIFEPKGRQGWPRRA